MSGLTHFDDSGASRMVDVSSKPETPRSATASGLVRMRPETLALIRDRRVSKGDVFEVARLAEQPWLAGLLVAAPFAAAMSTVDSFMLMISSSLVRDLWQGNVQPNMSDKAVKRMSYVVTAVIGVVIMIGAINPPKFLQDIIVYCGSGLAVCFLMPVAMALYWPRVNTAGIVAAIGAGFATHLSLYVTNWITVGRFSPYSLLGIDPIIWGLAMSLIVGIVATLAFPPPPRHLVKKFFHA